MLSALSGMKLVMDGKAGRQTMVQDKDDEVKDGCGDSLHSVEFVVL